MLTPGRRTTPWLGNKGLTATVLLYLFGCWIIFSDLQATEGFMASPGQLIGAALTALTLIVIAFAVRKPERPAIQPARPVPRPWLLGVGSFVMSSVFFARPEDCLLYTSDAADE